MFYWELLWDLPSEEEYDDREHLILVLWLHYCIIDVRDSFYWFYIHIIDVREIITIWLINTTYCGQRFLTFSADSMWKTHFSRKFKTKASLSFCQKYQNSILNYIHGRITDGGQNACRLNIPFTRFYWRSQSSASNRPTKVKPGMKSNDSTRNRIWTPKSKEPTSTSLQKVNYFRLQFLKKKKLTYDYTNGRVNKKTLKYMSKRSKVPKFFAS